MPIDYSKWNNIEISDDEDIECHPNIDKASFVRFKQREIHRQREERKERIAQLKANAVTNEKLLPIFEDLLKGPEITLENIDNVSEALKLSSPVQEGEQNYGGLMAELLSQIKQHLSKEGSKEQGAVMNELLRNRAMMMEVMEKEKAELEKLLKEQAAKVTMEGIHVSQQRTIINKKKDDEVEEVEKKTTTTSSSSNTKKDSKKQTIEVLNPESAKDHDKTEFIKTPYALQFSFMDSFETSYRHLTKHPELLTEEVSDELLGEAFNAQMAGKEKRAENLVRQALVIQYIVQLGKDNIQLFFERMASPQAKARKAFAEDITFRYQHIKTRCKVLSKERVEKEASQRLLEQKRTELLEKPEYQDPSVKLDITLPENSGERDRARAEAFNSFTPKFQRALVSGNLDLVNEALGEMEVEEQQRVLELCNETGLLEIEGEIEEE